MFLHAWKAVHANIKLVGPCFPGNKIFNNLSHDHFWYFNSKRFLSYSKKLWLVIYTCHFMAYNYSISNFLNYQNVGKEKNYKNLNVLRTIRALWLKQSFYNFLWTLFWWNKKIVACALKTFNLPFNFTLSQIYFLHRIMIKYNNTMKYLLCKNSWKWFHFKL